MDLKKYVKDVPNFPIDGILFKDITPILANGEAYSYTIEQIKNFAIKVNANKIVSPEARGFLFGCAVACSLKLPFIPVRKPNKLPREEIKETYDLEYGSNTICIHTDAIEKGDRVLIIDDLLATGGTTKAAVNLVERLEGEVVGISFMIELSALKGREILKNYEVLSLINY